MRRILHVVLGVSTAALLLLVATSTAGASSLSSSSRFGPTTLSYSYFAGHPTFFGGPGTLPRCTGSYTIHGTSGSFILTAGHCGAVGTTVYGTSAAFGTVAARHFGTTDGDSELISYYNGVTPYQVVVDPVTGRKPGPSSQGRITGIMPVVQQTTDTLVGKMGTTTGWTEGKIVGSTTWSGRLALVTNYVSDRGDSGGPVWRWDAAGLRAVGMHVGKAADPETGEIRGSAYIPIAILLNEWGAGMNVFSTPTSFNTSSIGTTPTSLAQTTVYPSEQDSLSAVPNVCAPRACILIPE